MKSKRLMFETQRFSRLMTKLVANGELYVPGVELSPIEGDDKIMIARNDRFGKRRCEYIEREELLDMFFSDENTDFEVLL